MTEEDHRMLRELHAAFMDTPIGSDEEPLIKDLRFMVDTYKPIAPELLAIAKAWRGGSLVARAAIWLVPTVALLITSWDAIMKRLSGG
jgi:hypothetical protein